MRNTEYAGADIIRPHFKKNYALRITHYNERG